MSNEISRLSGGDVRGRGLAAALLVEFYRDVGSFSSSRIRADKLRCAGVICAARRADIMRVYNVGRGRDGYIRVECVLL